MNLPTIRSTTGFTLIEIIIVVAIIGILATITMIMINPAKMLQKSQYARAKYELEEIAKAAGLYAQESGSWPADVNRNIPSGLEPYLGNVLSNWPQGPFSNSVFDWDNWTGQTCWEGSTGIIQVTLRQISDLNVVPGREWTMFHVIKGKGVPHCSTQSTEGECINCSVIYGARKQI